MYQTWPYSYTHFQPSYPFSPVMHYMPAYIEENVSTENNKSRYIRVTCVTIRRISCTQRFVPHNNLLISNDQKKKKKRKENPNACMYRKNNNRKKKRSDNHRSKVWQIGNDKEIEVVRGKNQSRRKSSLCRSAQRSHSALLWSSHMNECFCSNFLDKDEDFFWPPKLSCNPIGIRCWGSYNTFVNTIFLSQQ